MYIDGQVFRGSSWKLGLVSLSRSHNGDVGTCDLIYSEALKQYPEQNFLRSVMSYTLFLEAEILYFCLGTLKE